MRQPVAAVVAEAAVAARAPAQQAVQRGGLEGEQRLPDRVGHVEPGRLGVHGLLEPGGGLAGRRGEGDERRRRRGLLEQQREDARHRGRLAGAGAAGDDGETSEHGRGGRQALAFVGLATEQPIEADAQHRLVDGVGRRVREGAQVLGEPHLLLPVAVEVERAAHKPQRPAVVHRRPGERARGDGRPPGRGVGPGQGGEVDGLVGVDRRRVADGRQVDEDVAQARPADGERGGEDDGRVRLAGERAEPLRHVNVGGGEHAVALNGASSPVAPVARRTSKGSRSSPGVGVSGAAAGSSSMSGSWVMRRRPGRR